MDTARIGKIIHVFQKSDVRVIAATVTSATNTNSSGVVYTVQITLKYTHFPLFANLFGYHEANLSTPTPETTYVFTGTTPRIPYTVGAKATFTLTMNTPTTPYQNINLGTIEAEVLDV